MTNGRVKATSSSRLFPDAAFGHRKELASDERCTQGGHDDNGLCGGL